MKSSRQPVFFIGHGSPMNAVEDNPFTKALAKAGSDLAERPKAIMCVSAHWLTDGPFVCTKETPETIHDFGGFPDELYRINYPAPGAPSLARRTKEFDGRIKGDDRWGLDHGTWTVLLHMFPEADIPVYQFSVDYYKPMNWHFELAKRLSALRDEGVLVIGSGNIVHNLRLFFDSEPDKPFPWAGEFDEWVKGRIDARDFRALLAYEKQGRAGRLSVPTPDHYIPLLYALALAREEDRIEHFYEEIIASMSMRCIKIGG